MSCFHWLTILTRLGEVKLLVKSYFRDFPYPMDSIELLEFMALEYSYPGFSLIVEPLQLLVLNPLVSGSGV